MSDSAHDSNGFNPFLDPAEQTPAPASEAEGYHNPFSDSPPVKQSEAYINPFTDPGSPNHDPAAKAYRDPVLQPHMRTNASEPVDSYMNPFEQPTSTQGGTLA